MYLLVPSQRHRRRFKPHLKCQARNSPLSGCLSITDTTCGRWDGPAAITRRGWCGRWRRVGCIRQEADLQEVVGMGHRGICRAHDYRRCNQSQEEYQCGNIGDGEYHNSNHLGSRDFHNRSSTDDDRPCTDDDRPSADDDNDSTCTGRSRSDPAAAERSAGSQSVPEHAGLFAAGTH